MALQNKAQTDKGALKLRSNLLKAFLFLAGIAFTLWISLKPFVLPEEAPVTADPMVFSAVRAIQHLEHIAVQPRPVGSEGHRQAHEYILRALQKMGLTPEVQDAVSLIRFPGAPGFSAGSVKNIIVRIPGKNSSGAIALDAHYDAASTGPGAADCGACVATLLEGIRAILAGPSLHNDLIFVFSDAEEVGDLGAHAFASQHPWMKDVRLAINYEAMGTRGPVYLYASNKGNHEIIRAYAKASPRAIANSFIVGVFNLVPEQRLACDLQDYMDEGSAGYGFVFTGNTPAYHTLFDNIASLEPRTVQQLGESTLSLINYLGNANLNNLQSNIDEVFFTLWPGKLIHYSANWSLPLAIIGFILCLFVIAWKVQRKKLQGRKMVKALFANLFIIFLATLLTVGLWYGLKALNSNLSAFLIGNWAVGWFFTALLFFAIAFIIRSIKFLKPHISIAHQLAGAFLGFSLLAILFGVVYPIGNHIFVWPVLFGIPVLWVFLGEQSKKPYYLRLLSVFLVVIPTISLTAPLLTGANPWLGLLIRLDAMTGLPILALGVFFAVTIAALFVPLFDILSPQDHEKKPAKLKILSGVSLGMAILFLAIGWVKSGFDTNHPHPESIRYELDANQNSAKWVSGDYRLGEWTNHFIPSTDHLSQTKPTSILPYWPATFTAPAPLVKLQPPILKVLQDTTFQTIRSLRLQLSSPRMASLLSVRVDALGDLIMAQLEDQTFDLNPYDLAKKGVLQFNYIACPPEGIELTLKVKTTEPVRVSLVDMKIGLPPGLEQTNLKRPANTMPSPLGADCTVVRNVISIRKN